MHRRWIAALLLVTACRDSDGSGGTEGEEDTGDAIERPVPVFIEPASDALNLPVTASEDVALRVGSISLGLTRLEIDGKSFGSLGIDGPVGRLDEQQLILHVGGGLVQSRHAMQLVTPGPGEDLASGVVTVNLEAVDAPMLAATEPEATGLGGFTLAATGRDDAGVLVLADADQRAHVLPAEGAGWSVDGVRTVELPGLLRGPDDVVPPVSATRVGSPDEIRLRLAWRVGLPGERIDVADVDLADGTLEPAVTVVDLDPDSIGTVEYAALDRPLWVGVHLLAELTAATDAEQPRPGDHAIVAVRIAGETISPGLIKRLGFGVEQDLDRMDGVVDLTSPVGVGPKLLGARMGGVQPVVIELNDDGSVRLRTGVAAASLPGLSRIDGPLVTMVGAFGSRTVGALSRVAEVATVVQIDDLGTGAVTHVLPPLEQLGSATGPMVGALMGGAPLFLIPMGADEPTLAIVVTSGTASVQPLDPLRCDRVAVPATAVANAEAAIRVGCLIGGELRLGTVRVLR